MSRPRDLLAFLLTGGQEGHARARVGGPGHAKPPTPSKRLSERVHDYLHPADLPGLSERQVSENARPHGQGVQASVSGSPLEREGTSG
jgi:hypothetical protein